MTINSSDAGDGIFRLCGSIPCLLMHWLLKSPVHNQAWYWLCKTENMYFCYRINFIYLGQAKSRIRFKIRTDLLWCLKRFRVLKVNITPLVINYSCQFVHFSLLSMFKIYIAMPFLDLKQTNICMHGVKEFNNIQIQVTSLKTVVNQPHDSLIKHQSHATKQFTFVITVSIFVVWILYLSQ